jgi:peptide/nickel transport system permease protein
MISTIEESVPKARKRSGRVDSTTRIAIVWMCLVVAACALAPIAFHLQAQATDVSHAYAGPSWQHWLGTDALGRDELARLLEGGRISLGVGAIAAFVAMIIGTAYGAVAGYYGGWLDSLLMRLVDVFLAVPTLFLLLFLAAMFHGNLFVLMIVIGVTSWLGPARLVRGEVLSIKERLYVEAARAQGADDKRIIALHVVPNAFGTIVTTSTFMIATAMLAETALSFLGIGVRPPTPSWGNLLSSAQTDIFAGAWWLVLPPGLAILTTVCALNFIGDWLREGAREQW